MWVTVAVCSLWHQSKGCKFEAHPKHITFVEIGHEKIYIAILSKLLIQVGTSLATGKSIEHLVLVNCLGGLRKQESVQPLYLERNFYA